MVALTVVAAPSATARGQQRLERHGIVVTVLTGDTLLVRTHKGQAERVRLVGVRAGTCYERQALAETHRLALGRQIVLSEDLSQGIRAADGALLAYVGLPGGSDLGSRLVRGGFATVSYRQPFARLRGYRLVEAQQHARGLWSSACSDVSLSLRAAPSPVTLGNELSYDLHLQNERPSPTQVTVKLSFSAPVTVATDEPGCRSSGSSGVVCRLALEGGWRSPTAILASPARAAMPPPPPGSHTVYLSVSSAAPGELTTRAEASATKPDPTPDDNSATVTTTVKPGPASADLALTMSSDPQPVQAGGPLLLTATVTNLGPSEATGVAISDPIPAGIEPPFGFSYGTYELAPGQSGTSTIMVFHSPANPITNTASVSASTPDPNSGNNSASITTAPGPGAASPTLGLEVTATPTPVRVGKRFAYVLTVTNNGPGAASGVELQNTTPGNEAELLAVEASQGACDHELACNLGTLAAGAKATLTLSYRARHVGYGAAYDYAYVGTAAVPNPWFSFVTGPYADAAVAILPATPPTFLIGPDRIGRLRLSAQTAPPAASDAFGVPQGHNGPYGEFCDWTWPFGLTITFANFAGQDPCGFGQGLESPRLVSATMRGSRWTTSRGLRIGDAIERIHQLYPHAKRHGRSYWLVARRSQYGSMEARLAAIVWAAHIHAFRVNR